MRSNQANEFTYSNEREKKLERKRKLLPPVQGRNSLVEHQQQQPVTCAPSQLPHSVSTYNYLTSTFYITHLSAPERSDARSRRSHIDNKWPKLIGIHWAASSPSLSCSLAGRKFWSAPATARHRHGQSLRNSRWSHGTVKFAQ